LNRLASEATLLSTPAIGHSVPQADVAVVITAGNYGQGGIWNRWRDEIVARQILAAIR
jgi:hypothetical protein